jgi:glycerate-2-kinase
MQVELKQNALEILEAGLSALKPEKILNKTIWDGFKLPPHQKIYVIGAGKGVRFLAQQLEQILGDKIASGFVNDIEELSLNKITVHQASHPLPDKSSLAGTQKIIQLLRQTSKNDLIICLLTGGGSSLLTWPTFSVRRLGEFTDKLIKSGASIFEINIVRKHIDRVKGGGLAALIYPRPCLSLIVSDVPGNDLSTIAGGPTVFDKSTKEEAEEIFKKYALPCKIAGSSIRLIETSKDKKIFRSVKNILLATNKMALGAMKEKAEGLGYNSKILCDNLEGEAGSVGQILIKISNLTFAQRASAAKAGSQSSKLALIAGGETTVRVTGKGRGGRNTHLCLSALPYLPQNTVLLAIDSDGQDNTGAAGAMISRETIQKAQELGLNPEEYLKNFDSYNFFKKTGDLIFTGPLPTNVGDLIVVIRN